MRKVILGLDPGTQYTGYGAVEVDGERIRHLGHGVIRLTSACGLAGRLQVMAKELQVVFEHFLPTDTVVERIFLGKNADSAFKLGHARGVCLLMAAQSGSQVSEYAARFVKKTVAGHGGASKEHVRMVVLSLLQINSTVRIDATDALSLALCHQQQLEYLTKIQKMESMQL